LQLSIYAHAARGKVGDNHADHLVLYNLEGKTARSLLGVTDFQLNEARSRVTEVAANIAAGKF